MINYKEINSSMIEAIKDIYRKESWNAYLKDDEKLIRAFDNSLYTIGAFDDCKLVGFIRCVGDVRCPSSREARRFRACSSRCPRRIRCGVPSLPA